MRRTSVAAIGLGLALALPARQLLAEPGSGVLFGTTGGPGSDLIRIDTSIGAGSLVGSPGVGPLPSLAVDPKTGIMYAGGGQGTPNVYELDPNTGAATLVGNSGLGVGAIGAMDFNIAGTLFAAVNIAGDGGTGSDHLATINTATGAGTVIGPFGVCTGVTVPSTGGGSCTIDGMEAIAFAPGGTLYGAVTQRGASLSGAPAGLYTINTTTGAATFVASILDSTGTPPSGGVSSLQFNCNGVLFGGTARTFAPATDGGNLIVIDPADGVFSTVGNAVPGGESLAALAFQATCHTPTNTPGSAIPVVTSPGSPAGVAMVAGLALCMIWLLRFSRQSGS